MMKIGIISDTHNVLRKEVVHDLETCDAIIHAGDITTYNIIEKLQSIAPLYIVRGNNDTLDLPETLNFKILDYSFYLTHQKKILVTDVDFYIYGHSHQYTCEKKENVVYLNPGSCGRRRFSLPLTYAILYLEKEGYHLEKKMLP